LAENVPDEIPDDIGLSQMPQCMPQKYKRNDGTGTMEDTVHAYRAYYEGEKLHFCTYTRTPWPEWLSKPSPVGTKSEKSGNGGTPQRGPSTNKRKRNSQEEEDSESKPIRQTQKRKSKDTAIHRIEKNIKKMQRKNKK
jgi:hypothetical protein